MYVNIPRSEHANLSFTSSDGEPAAVTVVAFWIDLPDTRWTSKEYVSLSSETEMTT